MIVSGEKVGRRGRRRVGVEVEEVGSSTMWEEVWNSIWRCRKILVLRKGTRAVGGDRSLALVHIEMTFSRKSHSLPRPNDLEESLIISRGSAFRRSKQASKRKEATEKSVIRERKEDWSDECTNRERKRAGNQMPTPAPRLRR